MVDDFAVFARDYKRARAPVEILCQIIIDFQTVFENFGFKVGNFIKKMTLLAVVVRIVKRKPLFVAAGDKGKMLFVFIKQLKGCLMFFFCAVLSNHQDAKIPLTAESPCALRHEDI